MQLGGSGPAEVKGWSDAEVDIALANLEAIQTATENLTHFNEVITVSLYFLILIAGINFGYMISRYFLPTAADIGARL